MRVFTPGMKVIYGLCGKRVCLLLVFVFAWSSSSVTAANNIPVPLRHYSSLTSQQLNSSVTIVFKDIDKKNRKAVDFARREVRRKILEYLKRKKSTAASTSWSTTAQSTSTVVTATVATSATPDVTTVPTTQTTTAAALTAAPTTFADEATTQTLTTVATSAVTTQSLVTTIITAAAIITEIESTIYTSTRHVEPSVSPNRKRRRRDSEESNCIITEEDIIFVETDPETDKNGNLSLSFSIDNKDCKGIDLFEILTELNKLNKSDDGLETVAPVVDIIRGLPPVKAALAEAGYQVWLPILLATFLLLIIFIFVCCWKATHKKRKANDSQKIIPTQDSEPSPWNGHAPPRILDDNYGWLVPYEQFSSEQK